MTGKFYINSFSFLVKRKQTCIEIFTWTWDVLPGVKYGEIRGKEKWVFMNE